MDGVVLRAAAAPTVGAGTLLLSASLRHSWSGKDAVPWSSVVLGRAGWMALAALLKNNNFFFSDAVGPWQHGPALRCSLPER